VNASQNAAPALGTYRVFIDGRFAKDHWFEPTVLTGLIPSILKRFEVTSTLVPPSKPGAYRLDNPKIKP
jgi:hypothetical protein